MKSRVGGGQLPGGQGSSALSKFLLITDLRLSCKLSVLSWSYNKPGSPTLWINALGVWLFGGVR